jgi:integrase
MLIAEVIQRGTLVSKMKTPTMRDFSVRFLTAVDDSERLDADTKRYYHNGWRLLSQTPLAELRLRDISKDAAESVKLSGSPANQNNALRTLRRMLWRANEWKVLRDVPRFSMVEEHRRDRMIEPHEETALLPVCEQPLQHVLICILDGGLRPEEVFRMRWEYFNWNTGTYFNPSGKTKKSRRLVFMSDRMKKAMVARWDGLKTEGWVFPARNKQSVSGHVTTVQKQFQRAKVAAKVTDPRIVLYCARHTFGTVAMAGSNNPAAVMDSMGHEKLETTMQYQHQNTRLIRDAIDRNNRKNIELGRAQVDTMPDTRNLGAV